MAGHTHTRRNVNNLDWFLCQCNNKSKTCTQPSTLVLDQWTCVIYGQIKQNDGFRLYLHIHWRACWTEMALVEMTVLVILNIVDRKVPIHFNFLFIKMHFQLINRFITLRGLWTLQLQWTCVDTGFQRFKRHKSNFGHCHQTTR